MSDKLRLPAEEMHAAELAALAKGDKDRRPAGWALSPRTVVTYLMGGSAADGTPITPKYVGDRRLIETAEGAAEGRGFSWLTVLPAPSPIEGAEGDASGLTAAEWRARGFRYYRRTPEGRVGRIKRLQPDPGMAARRRTAGGG